MAEVLISVRDWLLTKTAITNIVSQRIYADHLPQGAALPAATLTIIDEVYDHALDGLAGLVQTRLQVECFATTRKASLELADAIIWSGIDQIKGTYTGVKIRSVMVEEGRRCFSDPDLKGGDAQRYVTNFDFQITWLRS